mgnify:FL=1|tara:strand:- start:6934 stop:7329 length:396 start_codon:yes stop_codon:yes gene_type:complete
MAELKGISPKQTVTSSRSSQETASREVLRRGWNTENAIGEINGKKRVITPFRAVNNLGDFLSRKNYVCGGPNQVNASKPGWKSRIGSIMSKCDSSGVEGASCNPKFVADSSDYVRFRKLQASNKNYNDTKR